MVLVRMPACNESFLEDSTASVHNKATNAANNSQKKRFRQALSKGNRCGHDKNHFKTLNFYSKAKRRPHVIEESKRRIGQAISSIYRYSAFTGLFYHSAQEQKSGRRRRSESVEASMWLALICCLHSLHLQKMAVGFYDSGNRFHYYNYGYITKITGMSEIRTKRAMQLLQAEGILKTTAIKEKNDDGSFRTTLVKIEFTDKIFNMLELVDEFVKDRETISIAFHRKEEQLKIKRSKRDVYRKTSFNKKQLFEPKSLSNRLKPNYSSLNSGNGFAIKEAVQALIAKGISLADAIQIVKKQFPPNPKLDS